MESVETAMVIGGGGRGQALAKKLADEGLEVVVSPGNPGNEEFAHSTGVEITDVQGQLEAAKHYGADLTIVGPEDALNRNIAGAWRMARVFDGFKGEIFAPYANQAWIESDRAFAKKFAAEQGIPIGYYAEFSDQQEGHEICRGRSLAFVRQGQRFAPGQGCHAL